jgi:hypothetical protein
MYTFKILGGSLNIGDGKIYQRGDVVQSEKELDKRFGARKFQRLDVPPGFQATAVAPAEKEDEFSGMTLAELKKFAEDEEIDLGSATRKEDVLAAIHKAVA